MSDNPVLTREQARKVTRGRTPLVPLEYESALNALAACISLDEAKYWSDKADALAAWARMFHSDEAGRQARALKLHAYRRMGVLAEELRPAGRRDDQGRPMPGPIIRTDGEWPRKVSSRVSARRRKATKARILKSCCGRASAITDAVPHHRRESGPE